MFEKLKIKNFQRHGELEVEFDPKITTIIGQTDTGKSAILRALRWLCLNNSGEGFIKKGEDFAEVSLFVEGRIIRRKRGKPGNFYYLDDEEFCSFNLNVPDSIKGVLNVGERNFQEQLDPVFWFSDSAPEVSRQLNSVVDLGIIDESLGKISGRLSGYKEKAKVCRERLREINSKKKALEWVEKAHSEYLVVEELETQLSQKTAVLAEFRKTLQDIGETKKTQQDAKLQLVSLRLLQGVASELEGVQAKRSGLSKRLVYAKEQKSVLDIGVPDVSVLTVKADSFVETEKKVFKLGSRLTQVKKQKQLLSVGVPNTQKLFALYDKLNEKNEETKKLKEVLQTVQKHRIVLERQIPKVDVLVSKYQSYRETRLIKTRLRMSLEDLTLSKDALEASGSAYQEVQVEFETATSGKCPICGGEMKKNV